MVGTKPMVVALLAAISSSRAALYSSTVCTIHGDGRAEADEESGRRAAGEGHGRSRTRAAEAPRVNTITASKTGMFGSEGTHLYPDL